MPTVPIVINPMRVVYQFPPASNLPTDGHGLGGVARVTELEVPGSNPLFFLTAFCFVFVFIIIL